LNCAWLFLRWCWESRRRCCGERLACDLRLIEPICSMLRRWRADLLCWRRRSWACLRPAGETRCACASRAERWADLRRICCCMLWRFFAGAACDTAEAGEDATEDDAEDEAAEDPRMRACSAALLPAAEIPRRFAWARR